MNIILILFCITGWLVHDSLSETWEFGRHAYNSVTVADKRDSIPASATSVNLRVLVPPCYKVQYVKVEVENPTATPVVEYRARDKTVGISYGPGQSSASTFHVQAEATRIKHCNNRA